MNPNHKKQLTWLRIQTSCCETYIRLTKYSNSFCWSFPFNFLNYYLFDTEIVNDNTGDNSTSRKNRSIAVEPASHSDLRDKIAK